MNEDDNDKTNQLLSNEENEEFRNNILYSNSFNENEKKENKIKLTTSSKNLLIMKITIIALSFLYIPMEIILEKKLLKTEIEHIFPLIKTINNSFFLKFSDFIENKLIHKDSIMIYICIIYVLFHPIIGLKITIVMNIFYFFGILIKCLIQGKRPNWLLNEDIQKCYSSFSNPCVSFFNFSFFYLYTLISFKTLSQNENQKNFYSSFNKIIIFSIYFFILFTISLIYLFYKIHFIFEIIYTFSLSLISITIIIDFDKIIQNNLCKKLKNIFKARKHKIRIFLYVIGMQFFAVISYFLMVDNIDLNEVEDKILNSKICTQQNKEELGLQNTFSNISYIFGIVGAFWGVCLTIEFNVGKWWNSNFCFSIIKIIITLIFSFIIQYSFYQIHYITYEFNFVIDSLKYFSFYFINFGFVPILFQLFKLTDKNFVEFENKKRKISLFKPSIFAMKKRIYEIKILENEIKND